MVERHLAKVDTGVRFPSFALPQHDVGGFFYVQTMKQLFAI